MAEDVTWATDVEVTAALGTTAVDPAWLASCTDAANAWAFRKRAAAGYTDDPAVAPGPDAALGAALYGAALYQSRGGGDAAVSFDQADQLGPSGSAGGLGHILRLLGVGKAQVA